MYWEIIAKIVNLRREEQAVSGICSTRIDQKIIGAILPIQTKNP
jgi:hypothetical protein